MTDLTIPAEAVQAAGAALHLDACTDDDHGACDSGDWDREAHTALETALPILHPTIPNTVEALGALPLRSVAQGVDDDGDVVLIFRDDLGDWGCLGDGEAYPTAQAVALAENLGITEWTVLWPLGGAA